MMPMNSSNSVNNLNSSSSSKMVDLVLKPTCERCGSTAELYGTECKHMTLCRNCGKSAATARAGCVVCGKIIRNLIREYNVRANASTDKTFYIGRFATGLPPISKKKYPENKWSLHKEGLQGRQLTDGLRDRYRNKPWILEDETGQHQYQGQIEGAPSAAYYLLVMHGKEFVASPAGSWYNFNKIAQYKQLTLEEAEEKMSKRRTNATGYERWMMKAAVNGPAAFGEKKSDDDAGGLVHARPKKLKNSEGADNSDKGEEDEDEEAARKSRLGLDKKEDDDEGGGKGGDFDLDDDDIEKGDDWEHEETFTDDDEAVGNDPEEREDLAPEVPAPPEIKQDDEDEGEEEEGGLSKSGKELKKLLGKAAGLNESDADDDDDDDEDMDDEVGMPPVLTPKEKEVPKDEPVENTPAKASKSSKPKRKAGPEDAKASNGTPSKKIKVENDAKTSSIKDEPSSSKATVPGVKSSAAESSKTASTPTTSPVPEEEIRNVLLTMAPITTQDLAAMFKRRLKSREDRLAFTDTLKRMSKVVKKDGQQYVLLSDKDK